MELGHEDIAFHNIFSVPSAGNMTTLKNRAIVEHVGDDDGSGKWSCSKDIQIMNCAHIISARNFLRERTQKPVSDEESDQNDNFVYEGESSRTLRCLFSDNFPQNFELPRLLRLLNASHTSLYTLHLGQK